jgi:hypothetical protein
MNAYIAPAPTGQAPASTIHAELHPSRHGNAFDNEIVKFFLDQQLCGVVTLPHESAIDLVHRLAGTPSSLSILTAKVCGHVRNVLDRDYNEATDLPDDWTLRLITLIEDGDEGQRGLLGLGYSAYVTAVTIATSPDGLATLRRLHTELVAAGAADGG